MPVATTGEDTPGPTTATVPAPEPSPAVESAPALESASEAVLDSVPDEVLESASHEVPDREELARAAAWTAVWQGDRDAGERAGLEEDVPDEDVVPELDSDDGSDDGFDTDDEDEGFGFSSEVDVAALEEDFAAESADARTLWAGLKDAAGDVRAGALYAEAYRVAPYLSSKPSRRLVIGDQEELSARRLQALHTAHDLHRDPGKTRADLAALTGSDTGWVGLLGGVKKPRKRHAGGPGGASTTDAAAISATQSEAAGPSSSQSGNASGAALGGMRTTSTAGPAAPAAGRAATAQAPARPVAEGPESRGHAENAAWAVAAVNASAAVASGWDPQTRLGQRNALGRVEERMASVLPRLKAAPSPALLRLFVGDVEIAREHVRALDELADEPTLLDAAAESPALAELLLKDAAITPVLASNPALLDLFTGAGGDARSRALARSPEARQVLLRRKNLLNRMAADKSFANAVFGDLPLLVLCDGDLGLFGQLADDMQLATAVRDNSGVRQALLEAPDRDRLLHLLNLAPGLLVGLCRPGAAVQAEHLLKLAASPEYQKWLIDYPQVQFYLPQVSGLMGHFMENRKILDKLAENLPLLEALADNRDLGEWVTKDLARLTRAVENPGFVKSVMARPHLTWSTDPRTGRVIGRRATDSALEELLTATGPKDFGEAPAWVTGRVRVLADNPLIRPLFGERENGADAAYGLRETLSDAAFVEFLINTPDLLGTTRDYRMLFAPDSKSLRTALMTRRELTYPGMLPLLLRIPGVLAYLPSSSSVMQVIAAGPEALAAAVHDRSLALSLVSSPQMAEELGKAGPGFTEALTSSSALVRGLLQLGALHNVIKRPGGIALATARRAMVPRTLLGHRGAMEAALEAGWREAEVFRLGDILETLGAFRSAGRKTHWKGLFASPELLDAFGRPAGLSLLRTLGRENLLVDVLARPALLATLVAGSEAEMLELAENPDAISAMIPNHPPVLLPWGQEITPEHRRVADGLRKKVPVDTILAGLSSGEIRKVGGRETLLRLAALLAAQEDSDSDRRLRGNTDALLAMLIHPVLVEVLEIRPGLAGVLFDPQRDIMSAIAFEPRLAYLLRDSGVFADMFPISNVLPRYLAESGQDSKLFDYLRNPEVVRLAHDQAYLRKHQMAGAEVVQLAGNNAVAMAAMARDPEVFPTLARYPGLVRELNRLTKNDATEAVISANGEDVRRPGDLMMGAAFATRQTLTAMGEDQELAARLLRLPDVAKLLADRGRTSPDLAALLDRAALNALGRNPGALAAVAERPRLALVAGLPGLARLFTDPGAVGVLERPGLAAVFAANPKAAAAFAADAGFRKLLAAHPRLADALARGDAAALALATRPDLVSVLTAHRGLTGDLLAGTPLGQALLAVRPLARVLAEASAADSARLRRAEPMLRALADLSRAEADAIPAELLDTIVRSRELRELLGRNGELTAALMRRPDLAEQIVARPDRLVAWLQTASARAAKGKAKRPDRLAGLADALANEPEDPSGTAASQNLAPTPEAVGGPTDRDGAAPGAIGTGSVGPATDATPELPPGVRLRAALPRHADVLDTYPALADELASGLERDAAWEALAAAAPALDGKPELLAAVAVQPELLGELADPAVAADLSFAGGVPATSENFDDDLQAYLRHLAVRGISVGAGQSRLGDLAGPGWRERRARDIERAVAEQARVETALDRFRAHVPETWELSGEVRFADGVVDAFTPDQLTVLRRAATSTSGIRERAIAVNRPLHLHLDQGSGGASVAYVLNPDGRVDLLVYARASRRSDNAYQWIGGGAPTSGPAPWRMTEDTPELRTSERLVRDLTALRRAAAAPDDQPRTARAPKAIADARTGANRKPAGTGGTVTGGPTALLGAAGGQRTPAQQAERERGDRPAKRAPQPLRGAEWRHRLPLAKGATLAVDVRVPDAEGAVFAGGAPIKLPAADHVIRAEVRRIQAADGRWVRHVTVPLRIAPGDDKAQAGFDAFARRIETLLDHHVNENGYVLGNGDQLVVDVRAVVDPADPDAVRLTGSGPVPAPEQRRLDLRHNDPVLLHEMLHGIGLVDEYSDSAVLLRGVGSDSVRSGGPMSDGVGGLGLRQRHLDRLDIVLGSGPVVRDLPFDDAAVPGPAVPPPDADTLARTAVLDLKDSDFMKAKPNWKPGPGSDPVTVKRHIADALPKLSPGLRSAMPANLARMFTTRMKPQIRALEELAAQPDLLQAAVDFPPLGELLGLRPEFIRVLVNRPGLVDVLTGQYGIERTDALLRSTQGSDNLLANPALLDRIESDPGFAEALFCSLSLVARGVVDPAVFALVAGDRMVGHALSAETPNGPLNTLLAESADPVETLLTVRQLPSLMWVMSQRPGRVGVDELRAFVDNPEAFARLAANPAVHVAAGAIPGMLGLLYRDLPGDLDRDLADDPDLLAALNAHPALAAALYEAPQLGEWLVAEPERLWALVRSDHSPDAILAGVWFPMLPPVVAPSQIPEAELLAKLTSELDQPPIVGSRAVAEWAAAVVANRRFWPMLSLMGSLPGVSEQVHRVLVEEPAFTKMLLAHATIAAESVDILRLFRPERRAFRDQLSTREELWHPAVIGLVAAQPTVLPYVADINQVRDIRDLDPDLTNSAVDDPALLFLLFERPRSRLAALEGGAVAGKLLCNSSSMVMLQQSGVYVATLLRTRETADSASAMNALVPRALGRHSGALEAFAQANWTPADVRAHAPLLNVLLGHHSVGRRAHWMRLIQDPELLTALGTPGGLALLATLARENLLVDVLARPTSWRNCAAAQTKNSGRRQRTSRLCAGRSRPALRT
ncbi:hypothetical protein BX266_5558 [Streptomyces sp. TLI_171]|nr:hypothetical protein BX266_5558 [Streptomyces sp. TLI_171]